MKEETDKTCNKITSKKHFTVCGGKIVVEPWTDDSKKFTCVECGDYKVIREEKK